MLIQIYIRHKQLNYKKKNKKFATNLKQVTKKNVNKNII